MNNTIFNFFYGLSHQYAFIDDLIIFFAVYFPLLILFGVCVFILVRSEIYRERKLTLSSGWELVRTGLIIIGPAFLVYVAASVLKELVHLDRSFVQFSEITPLFNPNQEYSFPSTHAAIFSALAFSIFFLHKKAGYAFMFFALLIGLARVIAGVHFPLDILGGFILGALVAYVVRKLTKI